jgi:hypothetical protein
MTTIEFSAQYSAKPGKQNTDQVLELVKKRADELNIKTILVASTNGDTGVKAAKVLQGYNVVVVTHSFGWTEPNKDELTSANRASIEKAGAKILTCQHAFCGITRAARMKWNTYGLDDIIASTLRLFGEGMKVCVEITLMAADSGLVESGKSCIAIGGTGHGADTAVLLRPANMPRFFDLRVMEILTKPRDI